jgi:biopolymer transport protein ExbD
MLPPIEEIEIDRIHGRDEPSRRARKRDVEVDMNPMVDLAFLLLTFFMLATTFIKPQAMELMVPAKPKAEDIEKEMPVKESKTMSLVLHETKVIWYKGITNPDADSILYTDRALLDLLGRMNNEIDGLVVLIKPLPESDFENLVLVLDALNIAGVQRYALAEPSVYDLDSLSNFP